MEKVKNFIKNNKGLSVIIGLGLILFIFILVIFIQLLVGGSTNKYGNRLDGIEKVEIKSEEMSSAKKKIEDSGLAEEADIRIQGKIVYTTIVLKGDTAVDKAKELASSTIGEYSEEQRGFYDFSFFLKWKGEDKDTIITGNKHHNLEEVTWVKS